MRAKWAAFIAGTAAIAVCAAVRAESFAFPTKPVRVIVPYAAGGGVDSLTRVIAQGLGATWGQSVVVDNRPGAGGTLGTAIAAKARPDGYTLTLNSIAIAMAPSLYQKLPFDTVRDLTPISLVASQPSVLVVNPSVPVNSLRQFIELARKRPQSVTLGSGGGAALLAIGAFRMAAGVDVVDVRYNGAGQALAAVMSGQIHLSVSPASLAAPHIAAGKVKALAVAGSKRSVLVPDLPTVAEAGLQGYEFDTVWYGVLGPGGMMPALVRQISTDLRRTLEHPDMRKRYAGSGLEPLTSTPEEFARYLQAEIRKCDKVIKEAGLTER